MPPVPQYDPEPFSALPSLTSSSSGYRASAGGGRRRSRPSDLGRSLSSLEEYGGEGSGHMVNMILHDEAEELDPPYTVTSRKRTIDAVPSAAGSNVSRKRAVGVESGFRSSGSLLDDAVMRVMREKLQWGSTASSSSGSTYGASQSSSSFVRAANGSGAVYGHVVGNGSSAAVTAPSASRGYVQIQPALPALDYCLVCRLESKDTEGLLMRCDFPACGRAYHPVSYMRYSCVITML
jgi:hypothetical protein